MKEGRVKMGRKFDLRAETNTSSSGRGFTRRSTLKGGLALGTGLTVGTFGIIGKASAAPVTMRFGSDSPMNAPHTKSALVMKELAEKGTSGRVQVTVFPDGQLGSTQEMINSVKAGTLDATVGATSLLAPAVPQIDVFSLPFLFKDAAEALRAANGPIGAKLTPNVNAAFECEIVGYSTDGMANIYTKRHPVRTPKDMAGLKMVCNPSEIQRDTVLAFDAIPTVLGITQWYTALQTGLVDCTRANPVDAVEFKVYQVTKYIALVPLFSQPNPMLISRKFLEKLSPADQDVIRQAGPPSCQAQADATYEGEKTALTYLRDHGMVTNEVESLQAFRDKVAGVYKKAADRVGADVIDAARKLASS
jgi:tripartite ATP-independent transporter DctP family solute receptor